MRQTMDGQAGALARILGDDEPVMAVAERLRGRRVLAIGTGTSWHAASQAAALLRAAGLDAWAAQSADAAVDGPLPGEGGALLVFTHTGAKRYTAQATQRAGDAARPRQGRADHAGLRGGRGGRGPGDGAAGTLLGVHGQPSGGAAARGAAGAGAGRGSPRAGRGSRGRRGCLPR